MIYSFETKVIRSTLIGLIIVASIIAFTNILIERRQILYVLNFISILSFIAILIYLNKSKNYKKAAFLFGISYFIIIVTSWFFLGGYSAHAPYWLNLMNVILIMITIKTYRKLVTFICFFLLIFLVSMQYSFPNLLASPSESTYKVFPYMIVLSSTMVIFLVFSFKENLDDEKERVNAQNFALKEKSEIIQEQNEVIQEINDNLEKKVKDRTKKLEEKQKELEQLLETKEHLLTALKREEFFSKSLLRNLPVGILVFDLNGNIVHSNNIIKEFLEIESIETEINIIENQFIRHFGIDQYFYKAKQGIEIINKEILLDFSIDLNKRSKRTSQNWIKLSVVPIKLANGLLENILFLIEDITVKKKTEEDLKISELQLNSIVESTSDYIALFDKNFQLLKWNKSYAALLKNNKNIDVYNGINLSNEYPEGEIRKGWENLMKRAYDGEHVQEFLTYNLYSKQTLYVDLRLYPVYEGDEIIGVTQFGKDITSERKLENQRVEQEQKLSTILNSLPIIIWSLNKDRTFSNVKGKGLNRLGAKKMDLIGSKVDDIFMNEVEIFSKSRKGIDLSESPKYYESEVNGYNFETYTTPLINEKGEKELIGISLDVTEKKHAELNLRISESYLKSIINSTKYAIWAINTKGEVTLFNRIMAVFFEKEFGDKLYTGKNILNSVSYVHKHVWEGIHERVFSGTSAFFEYEISNRYYEIVMNPIYINNEIEGIAVFSKDITDRKKSLDELKDRERFIDNVLRNIPVQVYINDADEQSTQYLNQPYFDQINNSKAIEIENQYIIDLCHPDDVPKLIEHYKQRENEHHNKATEIIVRLKNSKNKWRWTIIREVSLQLKNESGKRRYLGIATDIHSIREKEQALKQISEKLLLATRIAKLGICLFTPEEGLINPDVQAIELLHLDQKKGMSLDLFLSNIPDLDQKAAFSNAIFHAEKFKNKKIEFSFRTYKEQSLKFFEMIVTPVSNEEDNCHSVIGVIFDITDSRIKEKRLRQKQEKILETTKKVAEYKLMALRAVMNPHFLFNSLNSIQYFIAVNQKADALSYLSLFSKLIRKVINSSVSGTILLKEEIATIKYYVELERMRFENKFDFKLFIDPELNTEGIEIPSLLIQPFIENAILHGINNKCGKGLLTVKLYCEGEFIKCIIEDNGIGRERARMIKKESPLEHISVGLMLTEERLEIINKSIPVKTKITDLFNEDGSVAGTRVELIIKIKA